MLEVTNIKKVFSMRRTHTVALDGVSIHIAQGERVALVGSSGSGKSTLANVIVGLEHADSGTITYDGIDLQASLKRSKRNSSVRQKMLEMQMVFQNPAASFSPRMKVEDGIFEGIAYRSDFDCANKDLLIKEMLERVSLPASYAQKRIWELSGGECQRVAIARAIISNPRFLICDEPTSSLDVTVQAKIIALLDELCSSMGTTCLFVSHDLALISNFCSRAYVLDQGKVAEVGTPVDIFDHPTSAMGVRLSQSILEL